MIDFGGTFSRDCMAAAAFSDDSFLTALCSGTADVEDQVYSTVPLTASFILFVALLLLILKDSPMKEQSRVYLPQNQPMN